MDGISRRNVVAGGAALPLVATLPANAQRPIVEPFTMAVDAARLDRIARHVADTQWPVLARGTGWTYGVEQDWFRSLVRYWRDGYDWRKQERAINALPQFTVPIRGKRMHFVHVRSTNPAARPLLLLHGWPCSFWSFSEVIAPLARDFHLVVPSLPGTGFSEAIADTPRGLRAISAHIHALMVEVLGYPRYLIQASDHGAVIADWIALDRTAAVLGEQVNLVAFRHHGAEFGSGETGVADASPAEKKFVADEVARGEKESAYFQLQATRPETIAYALSDSPVGLAAYVLDKWQKWTDLRGRTLEQVYGRDRLITEVMLYLVTNSFATSIWSYAGFALEPFSIPKGRTLDVPYGYSGYPDPLIVPPPREFVARSHTNIVQWEMAERGGHFPFLEAPDRFVASFRKFAALVT